MTAIVMVAPHGRRVGGAETYLLDIAGALAERGNDVTLLHRTEGHDAVRAIRFVHVPRGADPDDAIVQLQPDVLHVHDDALAPGEATTALAAARTVRSLHNWWFGCSTGTLLRRGARPCPRAHGVGCLGHIATASCTERPNPLPALTRWRAVGPALDGVRDADAVIVHSGYAREVALRNGVPPETCHVLRYYVEPNDDPPPPPGHGRVCMIGRLTKLKGVDVLIRAVAQSARVQHLDVVGDGYFRASLERLAARHGVTDRVTFHGWRDAAGTRHAMLAADVVVVPSMWPEPFGIVGLEAMSAARAVLGASTGGIPEWLVDGTTGVLVPPGDAAAWAAALDTLLCDPLKAEQMGAAGRRHAREFTREHHLTGLLQIYRGTPATGITTSATGGCGPEPGSP